MRSAGLDLLRADRLLRLDTPLAAQVCPCHRIDAIAAAGCLDQTLSVDDLEPRARVVDEVAKAQSIRRDRHVGSSRPHCRGQKLVRHPQLVRAAAFARFQQATSETRFHRMQSIASRCLRGPPQQLAGIAMHLPLQ